MKKRENLKQAYHTPIVILLQQAGICRHKHLQPLKYMMQNAMAWVSVVPPGYIPAVLFQQVTACSFASYALINPVSNAVL